MRKGKLTLVFFRCDGLKLAGAGTGPSEERKISLRRENLTLLAKS